MNKSKIFKKLCKNCSNIFETKRQSQVMCSRNCRNEYYKNQLSELRESKSNNTKLINRLEKHFDKVDGKT